MKLCSLTLLLSDLAKHLPITEDCPAVPALQRLLSKGTRENLPADYFSHLFDHFSLKCETSGDRPVAALSALGDGLDASSGWWLCADPVHMVADRDQLYLSASAALGLSQSEADALVAELNRLYADEGWLFIAATPQRWYLRLPQPVAMRTMPTAFAMGRRVGEVLPQGDEALTWQRVMTEIQMVLHTNPINTQRSEEGLLVVNSLWFWGGGMLPETMNESEWSRVVADEPFVKGLARLHDVRVNAVSSQTSNSLLVETGRELWQVDAQSLEELEQQLFFPLQALLHSGKLNELVIELPGLARWRIDRKALRRWWRRPKPLAALLDGMP